MAPAGTWRAGGLGHPGWQGTRRSASDLGFLGGAKFIPFDEGKVRGGQTSTPAPKESSRTHDTVTPLHRHTRAFPQRDRRKPAQAGSGPGAGEGRVHRTRCERQDSITSQQDKPVPAPLSRSCHLESHQPAPLPTLPIAPQYAKSTEDKTTEAACNVLSQL